MRFLLDNDVDQRVSTVLVRRGHDVLTAADLHLGGDNPASDDHVSVVAEARGAVVVSHDRAFARRRIRNAVGRHLWLRCQQEDAMGLLEGRLDEVVSAFGGKRDCVVSLAASGVRRLPHRWS